jgi:hypothetical protein
VETLLHRDGNGLGIIRPSTGDLHMPADLDSIGDGEQTDSPYRVMLVIVTLSLIFISIITYLISQMPQKN